LQPLKLSVAALLAAGMLQAPALAQSQAPKVRGLIQTWYTADESALDAFTVRRVFLYINGAVTPQLDYSVLFNPAKYMSQPTVTGTTSPFNVSNTGDTRILEDAFLTAKLDGGWKVRMGQFRPPVSAEALASAGRIPLARRALFLEGNSFGFYRDIGLEVSKQALPGLTATLGVFNGQTTNQRETNEGKDLAGRLDYSLANLTLGASYLRGSRGAAAALTERIGANAAVGLGALELSAEGLAGQDGAVSKLGWYGQALWRFLPAMNAVLRVEEWDADQAKDGRQQDVTLGINWFLAGNSKLALNLINQTQVGPTPSRNGLAIVAWQLEL
jgi:hypothetical protein